MHDEKTRCPTRLYTTTFLLVFRGLHGHVFYSMHDELCCARQTLSLLCKTDPLLSTTVSAVHDRPSPMHDEVCYMHDELSYARPHFPMHDHTSYARAHFLGTTRLAVHHRLSLYTTNSCPTRPYIAAA